MKWRSSAEEQKALKYLPGKITGETNNWQSRVKPWSGAQEIGQESGEPAKHFGDAPVCSSQDNPAGFLPTTLAS